MMKSFVLFAAGAGLLALGGCEAADTGNNLAYNAADANAVAENLTDPATANATDEAATNLVDGKPVADEPSTGDAAAGATGKPPADEAVPEGNAAADKPTD